jgi:RNA polymerase sigma factor (sigma-70 family)
MKNQSLDTLTLEEIAEKCRQEDNHFHNDQKSDPRYCYELFRKAFLYNSQAAWKYIYEQYNSQMLRWIRSQKGIATCGEEAEYFVNRGFEKFWLLAHAKDFLESFPHLGGILTYLRMCLVSEYIDYLRKHQNSQYRVIEINLEENQELISSEEPLPEATIVKIDEIERFVEWINSNLKNEKEQIVFELAFHYGQTAREIYSLHQNLFSDVKQVHRVKENLLRRIRRNVQKQKSF